jgi:enoyl-CoA hydratase
MNRAYRLINNILALEKPLIAAVNGHAVGLGATIALFCDVIFASENARFSDPHVNVGLVAGDGGCVIWPLLIGVARAKRYLMTGDTIGAKDAEQIGLINEALPQDQVLPTAIAFAQRLANGPIKAIGWTKMSINEFLRHQVNLILHTSLATEYLCFESTDHAEAVNAFVEKRTPQFTGE